MPMAHHWKLAHLQCQWPTIRSWHICNANGPPLENGTSAMSMDHHWKMAHLQCQWTITGSWHICNANGPPLENGTSAMSMDHHWKMAHLQCQWPTIGSWHICNVNGPPLEANTSAMSMAHHWKLAHLQCQWPTIGSWHIYNVNGPPFEADTSAYTVLTKFWSYTYIGPVNTHMQWTRSSLLQIMAYHLLYVKPLPEPMTIYQQYDTVYQTRICPLESEGFQSHQTVWVDEHCIISSWCWMLCD